MLHRAGHHAVAVTPDGLDPERPTPAHAIDLDRHVAQVLAEVHAVPGQERDVVLVGHSYAGCLISGAADAAPERVRALVYLDAFVPEDGDSCWSMANEEERGWYVEGARRTGVSVDGFPFFDDRARPHPLGALMQQIALTGAWRTVPVKHYVAAHDWPGESPLAAATAKVRAEPDFTVHDWDTTHNVLKDGPQKVYDLLVGL